MHQHVRRWLASHPLKPVEVDCVTAVMLKILDGECKMPADEKRVMTELYKQVRHLSGLLLGPEDHALIRRVGNAPDEATKDLIYEQRVLAETRIARPTMKAFKAMIRERGLLDNIPGTGLNDAD